MGHRGLRKIIPSYCEILLTTEVECSRLASSSSLANCRINLKKSGRWPMKSPIAVRKLTTFVAIPLVSVGRMIEHGGSLRLRNGHGSGMIRFVWNNSPPNGEE